MKKITIITPCYNAEKYLAETMDSVLGQTAVTSGRVALEYLVQDGGSQDKTAEIARSFESHFVHITSERDAGMYDALAKCLQRASGEITAYLNAGDIYHRCAFDVVLDLFEKPEVRWLTGLNVLYNERSQVTEVMLPYKFRRELFACGMYDGRLPLLQQESTFWATALHDSLDWDRLAAMKYAGDYYLWSEFAKHTDLKIVRSHLGGFKIHRGQLSEDKGAYAAEMRALTRPASPRERRIALCDRAMWHAPGRIKKKFHPHGIYVFDHARQEWA